MYSFMQKSILVLFLLIFGVGVVNGQEDDRNQIIYINVDGYYTSLEPIEEFLGEVITLLEVDGIQVATQSGDYPSLVVIETSASGGYIGLGSAYPLIIANSTYLRTHEGYGFNIPYVNDEQAVNIVVGIIHYILGNYETALEYFDDVLQEDNNSLAFTLNFYTANTHLALGNYEEAREIYQVLLSEYTRFTHFPSLINLSWIYFQQNNIEDALELFESEIADSEGLYKAVLLSYRARLHALSLDYDSAIADIDEAITLAEDNEIDNLMLAELYTIRGEIIFLIYEWDRVEDNFDMAIALDPTYARAYFQRGVLFYTMARREDAMVDFEQYLALDPDGIYAEQATSYIDSIEIELEALGG